MNRLVTTDLAKALSLAKDLAHEHRRPIAVYVLHDHLYLLLDATLGMSDQLKIVHIQENGIKPLTEHVVKLELLTN